MLSSFFLRFLTLYRPVYRVHLLLSSLSSLFHVFHEYKESKTERAVWCLLCCLTIVRTRVVLLLESTTRLLIWQRNKFRESSQRRREAEISTRQGKRVAVWTNFGRNSIAYRSRSTLEPPAFLYEKMKWNTQDFLGIPFLFFVEEKMKRKRFLSLQSSNMSIQMTGLKERKRKKDAKDWKEKHQKATRVENMTGQRERVKGFPFFFNSQS